MKELKLGLSIFLFVVFFSANAFSEDIQQLNESGLQAFGDGRYVEAAELFGRAYALEPRPELLKNRAVALYRADKCIEALPVATMFLQSKTTDAERVQISALKDGCYLVLAEKAVASKNFTLAEKYISKMGEQPALDERVEAVRKSISDDQISRAKNEAKLAKKVREERTVALKDPIEPARDNTLAWTLIGVGSATLIGTAIYHVYEKTVTEDEFETVSRTASSRSRYDQLDRRLRLANWLTPTLYVAGLITTSIGLSVYFIPSENDKHFTGVAWRTSF